MVESLKFFLSEHKNRPFLLHHRKRLRALDAVGSLFRVRQATDP